MVLMPPLFLDPCRRFHRFFDTAFFMHGSVSKGAEVQDEGSRRYHYRSNNATAAGLKRMAKEHRDRVAVGNGERPLDSRQRRQRNRQIAVREGADGPESSTLKWSGFPETANEFRNLQSLKTHNLEVLLRLSGVEGRVKSKYLAEWSVVLNWNPEKRYQPIGQSTLQQAADMVTCAKRLLDIL